MSYSLGVDLGTTFTAAAMANGSEPSMVGLGNRALQIPSVLFLADDGFVVGEAAERRGVVEPDRVVREFKRRLGDHIPLLVGGSPFSAELLTARLLKWVVATSTERLGEAPESVVLTHPANWGPFKMEIFGQVATLADVAEVRWVPEPVAAAAQYASRARVEVGGKLAIYDLGGGTFDVCVVEKTATGFTMLGTPDGVEHLGGADLDHALFERVMTGLADRIGGLDPDDPGLAVGLGRLRRDCVEAKEALSTDVTTVVPVSLPGLSTTVRVTRSEFEEMIRPALEETIAATRRGLSSAGVEPSDLGAIVLIGGSSRIPLVGEMLQREFGIPAALDTHPKHDVALGAARLGHAVTAGRPAPDTTRQGTESLRPTADPTADLHHATQATPDGVGLRDQEAHWLSRYPVRSRTRAAIILVALAVATALVVLVAIRAQQSPTAVVPRSSPQGPNTTAVSESASTPSPVASAVPTLPQSAALDDSVIVWPRVRDGNWDIGTVNIRTGAEGRLTFSGEEDTVPVISRDRRTIIYSRRGPGGGLRVMGADGESDRPLFDGSPSGCGSISRPAWRGATLAIICQSNSDSGVSVLKLVSLDGTVIRQLDEGSMGDPTFTPDGTAVIYWKSVANRSGLYAIATDGRSEPVRLTDGREGVDADPAVSPDGKQIAFRRQTSGPRVIMTMGFDGRRATGAARARTRGPNDQDPSWSPDSGSIAYKHGPDNDADLWAVDLEGDRATQVIQNAEPDTAPAWTTR